MQALYAYFTAVESIKEVIREDLRKTHALDPARHDFADKALFEARKKSAVRLFNQSLLASELQTGESVEDEVKESVENAIDSYRSLINKETKARRNEMMNDARKLQQVYLKFLTLPIELEHREKLDKEKEARSKVAQAKKHYPFINHPVIKSLKESQTLQHDLSAMSISWGSEQDEIKLWYRDHIRKTDTLTDYFEGLATDNALVLETFKKSIFKNDTILSYFENNYLHWAENLSILKSMVIKTIKAVQEEGTLTYVELTKNGEEDFQFLEHLYNEVINQNEFLDHLIAKNTKNWDVERIAIIDRVILKLALVEMMHSPSIPVKVTINEAIEIAKAYSTPKSKQFINGVLDVLSNELTSMGKIRKSGRGLIDNR